MSKGSRVLTALILGDVIGQPGCRALYVGLKGLIKANRADVVVVNGENAADGFGLTPELMPYFFDNGVDVVTSGNHIWNRREIFPLLDSLPNLLRPANYPSRTPGKGFCRFKVKDTAIAVLNLQGRKDMTPIDCPFRVAKELLSREIGDTKVILVDFHAESTEEKEAMAHYLDGQVSVLVGTHTHVQTADEKILPGGTGYITDLGMIGPVESVIGSDCEISIRRSLTHMPIKLEVADSTVSICGIVVEIDTSTGKTTRIERIAARLGV